MKKIKYIILLVLLAGIVNTSLAQMNNFSQYHLTPVYTSPGEIGTTDYFQVMGHYRKQSLSNDLGYRAFALSAIYPLYYKDQDRRFGAIGLGLMSESSGALGLLNTTSFQGAYAYNWQINRKNYLSTGVQAGYFRRKIDISKITTDSQYQNGGYNPGGAIGENFSDDVSGAFMMDAGLSWYMLDEMDEQKASFGVGGFNLSQANYEHLYETDNKPQPMRFTTFGSYRVLNQGNIHLIPTFRWLYEENKSQLNIGARMQYQLQKEEGLGMKDSHLGFGLWYSIDNAAILALELAQPSYVIAISYDLPASSEINYNQVNNAVELTFGWRLNRKKGRSKDKSPAASEREAAKNEKIEEAIGAEEIPARQESPVEKEAEKVDEPKEEPTKDQPENSETTAPSVEKPSESKNNTNIESKPTVNEKKSLTPEEKEVLERDVEFSLSSTGLSPEAQKQLDDVVKILKAHPELKVNITGHTCTIGTEKANEALSLKRAEAAKQIMVEKGIAPERITTEGRAYHEPIASNDTPEGRQKNRRVEFEVIE